MDNLDWNAIRSLNGSKSEGFEELCAQMARVESPVDAKFVRKGTPGAGVECYCVLPDETEWGWQSKYFDSLNNPQWSQLDSSVKTALEKHPNLVRYFICVPMNRPDARIPGRKSALQRWDHHLDKWKNWAVARGMNVEFVWWGSSELLEKLADPKHIGRVHFWFDQRGFDQQWFQDRLKEAIDSAGPRYTPELHVDLPIARDLELFGHSDNEADRVKSLARDVRRELLYARTSSGDDEVPGLKCALEELLKLRETILSGFAELEFRPDRVGQLEDLTEALASAVGKADEVRTMLRRSESDSQASEVETESKESQSPLKSLFESILQLWFTLRRVQSEIDEAHRIANSSLMILKGDAGTGKTHLLCDVASARIERGTPTVLLMGQRFRETTEPWTQVLQQVGLQGTNTEEFVGALEAAAQAANRRALVLVDALNKGEGRSIWPAHLAAFLARLEQSPWIATLLAVRSTYEEAVVPEEIRERAVEFVHHGFGDKEYDAVQTFFSYYGIELPSTPILRPEFSNPLFLKIVCEGLKQRGEKRIPRGFHGITMAFDLYLDAVNGRLVDVLDYNVSDKLVRKALNMITGYFVSTGDRWLPREEATTIVNEFLPGRAFSRSLYNALVSEGVLLEDMHWPVSIDSEEVTSTTSQHFTDRILGTLRTVATTLACTVKRLISWNTDEVTPQTQYSEWTIADEPEEVVSISYERFADHIIADQLLRRHMDKGDPASSFGEGGGLAFVWKDNSYTNSGLIEAMCVQVPELTGKELVTLAPEVSNTFLFPEAFMQSVIWRRLDALTDDTIAVFNQVIWDRRASDSTLDSLLTVSTIPSHLFNSEFLDRTLRQYSMADRDAWWSTYLHHTYGEGRAVDRLLDWALVQASRVID